MKYYAIKEGFDSKQNLPVKHKIVHTWEDCKKYTDHVPGAVFKRVESEEQAYQYFGISKPTYYPKKNGFPFHIFFSFMEIETAMKSVKEPQFLCCLDSTPFDEKFKDAVLISSEVIFHVTLQSSPLVKDILSFCKEHQILTVFEDTEESLPWN